MLDKISCEFSEKKWKSSTYLSKNGRSIVISEADVTDARDLVNYVEQVCGETDFLSFGPGEFGITVQQEADILRSYHSSKNKVYLVARISERIVGALSFEGGSRPRMAHSGELAMSVIRNYWNEGIGSALIDEFFRWCETTGMIKKVNLHVRSDNEKALRLYHKKGFMVEGTTKMDMCVEGIYYDHHIMGWTLTQTHAEGVADQGPARHDSEPT